MFDITGDDIARLSDADLRTLVARLALAELTGQGAPLSAVTAGGHQDAKDGGIDVRVELDLPLVAPDFVRRARTGFQVKKPDMAASSIVAEMRPKGVLRSAIGALADDGGAYIIVSAQGSVADKPLAERKQAMRDAVAGHPNAHNLLTDFYDRERLANWVNHYTGAAAWVRAKIGGTILGWRPIGRWSDTETAEDSGFLTSDKACLVDERSKDREKLSILDGIDRLRAALTSPRQCIRLIGMSGLGKTRLVQALFERGVGGAPLDPARSVYTDYSDDITPSALEMARRLVNSGERAILIVDNCNPATHGHLAAICSEAGSNISLLTVEYDVSEDEPERTEVFRLTNAANALVEEWVARDFPNVSQIDRGRIAEFSDGNFRVARALAETLRRGETLGQLKNRDLFERIFHQRNAPDNQLLHDAEVLALLYSFDGQNDLPDGELAHLAAFSGRTVRDLFGSIAVLRRRGVIQSRGRWRAVLPQAIANPLAARALERIPVAAFDHFSAVLPQRMLRSLSRRLGYLHDSKEAQAVVARWLRSDGPLGDLVALGEIGLGIIHNIAPVMPDAVLAKIASEIDGPNGSLILSTSNLRRWQWISLLKSLSYEPVMFVRAANLLARFVAAEPPEHRSDSATEPFQEMFHLYLSGTQATPAQRREVARALLSSEDPSRRRAGALALSGLLETWHFSSSANFDFGARPRDFGWYPKFNGDIFDWYRDAIGLAMDLTDRSEDPKSILARNARGLWRFAACQDALEQASIRFAQTGGWIEGWIAFRAAIRMDGKDMPDEIRTRLLRVIDLLKPVGLIEQARTFVLARNSGGYDVVDGEDDSDAVSAWDRASQTAVEIGKAVASERALVTGFLPEVIGQNPPERAFEFGRGLAQGADDLGLMWADIVAAFRIMPADSRNPTVAGGFLAEAHRLDPGFAGPVLDAAMRDPDLARILPYLQARVGLDVEGLRRLEAIAMQSGVEANDFRCLATGVIASAPAEPLVAMLDAVSGLEKGIGIALDILHMHFYMSKGEGIALPQSLLVYGRELLKRADFTDMQLMRDYGLGTVVKLCLAGPEATDDAKIVCANVRAALEEYRASDHDIGHLLKGLFKAQPDVALDCFLLGGPPRRNRHLFEFAFADTSPFESFDAETLCAWADKNKHERYPLLGRALSLFAGRDFQEPTGLSPLFLSVMANSPDKRRFLGDGRRLQPTSWSGSLADMLEKRKATLSELSGDPDPGVQAWLREQLEVLDSLITRERQSESEREETFE